MDAMLSSTLFAQFGFEAFCIHEPAGDECTREWNEWYRKVNEMRAAFRLNFSAVLEQFVIEDLSAIVMEYVFPNFRT